MSWICWGVGQQREALKRAGVGVVFDEKASGTKRDGRSELQKVLSILGTGDALVVTRLDRLGRSLRDLANIAHEIEQAGAHLKVVEQSVDTSSAAGRAFFGMLAVDRRPNVDHPNFARSMSCDADRRFRPTPIHRLLRR